MPTTASIPASIRHYDVLEKLGEGAGGVVYRGYDTRLHRPIVVKLLHRDRTDAGELDRLLEEARLASSIDHPNVCQVYYVGVEEGQPFLVMQYVEGRTLLEVMQAGPLSEALARSIGVQLASGLAAAHRRGVLHRDLKPANVIVADDGRAKILDFGLARRLSPDADPPAPRPAQGPWDVQSSRFGTTAYMAPEQFATRRSTAQSDLWALGVILFEMVTGQHPFAVPRNEPIQLVQAIQYHPLPRLDTLRPDLDPAFAALITRMLAKQPDDRYRHASEVGEALKALELADEPSAAPEVVPPPVATEAPRRSLLARLTRGRPDTPPLPTDAVAVLPFQDVGAEPCPSYYGTLLADAVATRLAQQSALRVRPPQSVHAVRDRAADPVALARRLDAAFVVTGQMACTPEGLHVNWHLLNAETNTVVTGGTFEAVGHALAQVQHDFSKDVFAAIEASGVLPISARPLLQPAAPDDAAIPEVVTEAFLEARALLNRHALQSTHEDDLLRACAAFERVLDEAPTFAAAHASLGVALTRYVRYGYGGAQHLVAAQRHLDRALGLDPGNIEAKLYRAYTLLWSGDKEQARHDVQYLLQTADYDAEVHVGAGVVLHLDGLLDASLQALGRALRLNPSQAPRVYNLRARVLIYARHPDEAWREIERGLALEPQHTLLRTTRAVWHLRHGDLHEAIRGLETVVAEDPHLRLTHPTLAIAYHRAGQAERARALLTDDLLERSRADCEMAYRIATYFAVAGDADAALTWLRTSIFLGNHNAPWFRANPDWAGVREHPGIRQTLDELAETQKQHRDRWKRGLSGSAA